MPDGDQAGLGVARLTSAVVGISLLTIIVGVLVLLSWSLDVNNRLPMKPFTALCFGLTGLALWLRIEPPAGSRRPPRWHLLLATACAAVVLLVGGAMLLEYLLGINLGLDGLLFHDALVDANALNLGRMSVATSLCMACFGLALLLVDVEVPGGQRPAQYLALVVMLVGLLGFEGDVFGPDAVFRTFPFAAMPLPASLLFVT